MKGNKRSIGSLGKEYYQFDLKIEKDIYCHVCRRKYKEEDLEDNLKFDTYIEWRQYIYNKYEHCDTEKLKEFSRYLNQRIRNIQPGKEYWNMLGPIMMTLAISEVWQVLLKSQSNMETDSLPGIILVIMLISMIVLIFFVFVVWHIMKPMTDNQLIEYLLVDYKEVIDDMTARRQESDCF